MASNKTSNISSNTVRAPMPEFLTRRNGTWHFVRRVPLEFAAIDPRRIVRHSTRIRIAHDRAGRRAARVAERLNEKLELTWKDLALGLTQAAGTRYEDARQRARQLGYEYLENAILLERPVETRLERLEALVAKGVKEDPNARAAVLGIEKPHGSQDLQAEIRQGPEPGIEIEASSADQLEATFVLIGGEALAGALPRCLGALQFFKLGFEFRVHGQMHVTVELDEVREKHQRAFDALDQGKLA